MPCVTAQFSAVGFFLKCHFIQVFTSSHTRRLRKWVESSKILCPNYPQEVAYEDCFRLVIWCTLRAFYVSEYLYWLWSYRGYSALPDYLPLHVLRRITIANIFPKAYELQQNELLLECSSSDGKAFYHDSSSIHCRCLANMFSHMGTC